MDEKLSHKVKSALNPSDSKKEMISEIIQRLRDLAFECQELATKLNESGRPLHANEKQFIRIAMLPSLRNEMEDLEYFFLKGNISRMKDTLEHFQDFYLTDF